MLHINIIGDFFTLDGTWYRQGSTVQMLNLVNALKYKVYFKIFEIGKDYPETIIDGIRKCGFSTVQKAIPFLTGDIIHYNNICYFEPMNKIVTGTIHTNVFLNKESAKNELNQIGRFFNKIFVVNNQYIDTLSNDFNNLQLIYNGVDTGIFKYNPPRFDGKLIKLLFPNRNDPCKNSGFALRLVQKLNELYPNYRFILSVVKGVNTNLSDINFFEEKKSPKEMYELYCQHPITIISSFSESCSLCALEAMATGSIVFYNALQSIRDYVGNAGYMIDINNISEWCRQIRELINDPQAQKSKKLLAHNRISKLFSLTKMSDKYYNTWLNLLQKDSKDERK